MSVRLHGGKCAVAGGAELRMLGGMALVNENLLKLRASYLFAEISRRVREVEAAGTPRPLIKLGIGDVTEPLPESVRKAFASGVDELAHTETFRGYGPYEGYDFLREAIARYEYQDRGSQVTAEEVFISDGSKCDSANLQELFAQSCTIAIPDPVYPVYLDSNVMAGRTGFWSGDGYEEVTYLPMTPQNGYVPALPQGKADLIYLCFPNNPTGAVPTHEQLRGWVEYAQANGAVILYDAAYVAFIQDESVPRSIYEVPGAREVAIEMRSYSKTAGFTGVRCAFTVIPKELTLPDVEGKRHSLHALWTRRQATKFNGVSFPVQRAAAAIYTAEGQREVAALVQHYSANAALIRDTLSAAGVAHVGGEHAPYVWACVGGDSWAMFDRLLRQAQVVCTPGAGFGPSGEGHIRLSAFQSRAQVEEAMIRLREVL